MKVARSGLLPVRRFKNRQTGTSKLNSEGKVFKVPSLLLKLPSLLSKSPSLLVESSTLLLKLAS